MQSFSNVLCYIRNKLIDLKILLIPESWKNQFRILAMKKENQSTVGTASATLTSKTGLQMWISSVIYK